MALSINLVPIEPSLTGAETKLNKINALISRIRHEDTFLAASQLLHQLKLLNRQKLEPSLRIDILELYHRITQEITKDLEDVYGNAATPLPSQCVNHAAIAEAIWLETGYGYKRALVDLKLKLINFKIDSQQPLVIYRAIEALKNEAQVNYLLYKSPAESVWSDLHKLYYHALQLAIENNEIPDKTNPYCKTINLIYAQTMLMHLTSPQRLDKPSIRKLSDYVASLAKYAQLRGMGFIDNPVGVFMIELDSSKPPVPYQRNKNAPSVETDILLLTIEVARQIHHQLKYLQQSTQTQGMQYPALGLDIADEELLVHLINYFGINNARFFPRMEKKQPATLSVGLEAATMALRPGQRSKSTSASPWEIINTSPIGYAVKTQDTVPQSLYVGELVTIKERDESPHQLGCIVWLNAKADLIEAGIRLLSSQAMPVHIKVEGNSLLKHALVLPRVEALQQPDSIITEVGVLKSGDHVIASNSHKTMRLHISDRIEKTSHYERYEYSLIDEDLS